LLRLIQSSGSRKNQFVFSNFALVDWPHETPYSLVEFDFQAQPKAKKHRVRQYWMQQDGVWKVVSESIL